MHSELGDTFLSNWPLGLTLLILVFLPSSLSLFFLFFSFYKNNKSRETSQSIIPFLAGGACLHEIVPSGSRLGYNRWINIGEMFSIMDRRTKCFLLLGNHPINELLRGLKGGKMSFESVLGNIHPSRPDGGDYFPRSILRVRLLIIHTELFISNKLLPLLMCPSLGF